MARHSLLSVLLLALGGLSSVTSAAAIWPRTGATPAKHPKAPPPPSKDPFYTAPQDYQHAAPGTVLRSRPAPGIASLVANSSAAWNILYRTTDSNYQPSWAVTTLIAPKSASGYPTSSAPKPGSILLSYQIPYDSCNVDDSPSYAFYTTPVDPSITTGLGLGWYVNVPDYEGPLAAFTAGVQSGHATIDAVRASLNFGHGLDKDARYALWGYSGGALASEWAAELQVQYAPEMKFAGAALGGLTPNVTSVEVTIDGTPAAELLVNGILGLVAEQPAAKQYIISELKKAGPQNATGFLAALHQNTTVDAEEYADQNIFGYFKNGAGYLQSPIVQALVDRDGLMGYHGVPAMPVFAYKAIHDEISVIGDTDALVAKYCAVGANIVYQRNTVGGHSAEAENGGPSAVEFLAGVLESTYTHTGCTIQNVTISINPSPE